jgi:hypothetical protein
MHVIEICLLDHDLAAEMAEMRTWLDEHGYEPSIFHYQHRPDGLVILVGFEIAIEAGAFAKRFGGRVIESDEVFRLLNAKVVHC